MAQVFEVERSNTQWHRFSSLELDAEDYTCYRASLDAAYITCAVLSLSNRQWDFQLFPSSPQGQGHPRLSDQKIKR
jgi:hypothetical protein